MLQAAFPVRNLLGRPVRTLLTGAGVAVAVASFIALVGMSRGLESAWVRSLEERGTHLLAVRRGAVEILTGSLEETAGAQLLAVPGVEEAAGELLDLIMVGEEYPALLTGWQEGSFLWEGLRLESGTPPGPGVPLGAYLGNSLAQDLGKGPGDTVDLLGSPVPVAGVFRPAGPLDGRVVLLPLDQVQAMLGRPGVVTEFNLRVGRAHEPEAYSAVRDRLAEAFPQMTFTATREVAEKNDLMKLLRAMAWGTSSIALVLGLFFVLNTLLMSVNERTREIGILSAVGWSGARIMGMVVLEGVCLSVLGAAAGVLLGLGALEGLSALPMIEGFLEPRVDARLLLEIGAASLALGVLGSAYPAWRASRLEPVRALRYE